MRWPQASSRNKTVMRSWWVNQNQTYRHEVPGGYLWAPKRKANGHSNAYYDFMREVAPGDVVFSFSFANTRIKAMGIAASHAYEAPKPMEFGQTGAYWDTIGWRMDVNFVKLRSPIRPADRMDRLVPLLPSRYSPLPPKGNGLQSVYLAFVPDPLAGALIDLIGREAHDLVGAQRSVGQSESKTAVGLVEWEEHEIQRVSTNQSVGETERKAIVLARRGHRVHGLPESREHAP